MTTLLDAATADPAAEEEAGSASQQASCNFSAGTSATADTTQVPDPISRICRFSSGARSSTAAESRGSSLTRGFLNPKPAAGQAPAGSASASAAAKAGEAALQSPTEQSDEDAAEIEQEEDERTAAERRQQIVDDAMDQLFKSNHDYVFVGQGQQSGDSDSPTEQMSDSSCSNDFSIPSVGSNALDVDLTTSALQDATACADPQGEAGCEEEEKQPGAPAATDAPTAHTGISNDTAFLLRNAKQLAVALAAPPASSSAADAASPPMGPAVVIPETSTCHMAAEAEEQQQVQKADKADCLSDIVGVEEQATAAVEQKKEEAKGNAPEAASATHRVTAKEDEVKKGNKGADNETGACEGEVQGGDGEERTAHQKEKEEEDAELTLIRDMLSQGKNGLQKALQVVLSPETSSSHAGKLPSSLSTDNLGSTDNLHSTTAVQAMMSPLVSPTSAAGVLGGPQAALTSPTTTQPKQDGHTKQNPVVKPLKGLPPLVISKSSSSNRSTRNDSKAQPASVQQGPNLANIAQLAGAFGQGGVGTHAEMEAMLNCMFQAGFAHMGQQAASSVEHATPLRTISAAVAEENAQQAQEESEAESCLSSAVASTAAAAPAESSSAQAAAEEAATAAPVTAAATALLGSALTATTSSQQQEWLRRHLIAKERRAAADCDAQELSRFHSVVSLYNDAHHVEEVHELTDCYRQVGFAPQKPSWQKPIIAAIGAGTVTAATMLAGRLLWPDKSRRHRRRR